MEDEFTSLLLGAKAIYVATQPERDVAAHKAAAANREEWKARMRFAFPIAVEQLAKTGRGEFIVRDRELYVTRTLIKSYKMDCDDGTYFGVGHRKIECWWPIVP